MGTYIYFTFQWGSVKADGNPWGSVIHNVMLLSKAVSLLVRNCEPSQTHGLVLGQYPVSFIIAPNTCLSSFTAKSSSICMYRFKGTTGTKIFSCEEGMKLLFRPPSGPIKGNFYHVIKGISPIKKYRILFTFTYIKPIFL